MVPAPITNNLSVKRKSTVHAVVNLKNEIKIFWVNKNSKKKNRRECLKIKSYIFILELMRSMKPRKSLSINIPSQKMMTLPMQDVFCRLLRNYAEIRYYADFAHNSNCKVCSKYGHHCDAIHPRKMPRRIKVNTLPTSI
jgi:hypothetical protein